MRAFRVSRGDGDSEAALAGDDEAQETSATPADAREVAPELVQDRRFRFSGGKAAGRPKTWQHAGRSVTPQEPQHGYTNLKNRRNPSLRDDQHSPPSTTRQANDGD